VNHQVRLWICKDRSKSCPNYAKYQISLWNWHMSINLVPPSNLGVNDVAVTLNLSHGSPC